MKPAEKALVVGATLRLTRAVTTDVIGKWLVQWPAYDWAMRKDPEAKTWRARLVSGLDCPFCVGFWIGLVVLAITGMTQNRPRLRRVWNFVMAGLTLNEVVGHIAVRVGDTPSED